MCLTLPEQLIIEELYEYNRIPQWIFNKDLEVTTYFYSDPSHEFIKIFPLCMKEHLHKVLPSNFDILYFENELYYMFSFEREGDTFYLLGGPMLLSGFSHITEVRSLSFTSGMKIKDLKSLVQNLPVVTPSSFSSCLRIMMLLLKQEAPSNDEIIHYKFSTLEGSLNRMFFYELFETKEDTRTHSPYSHELALLNYVKEGDVKRLASTYKTLPRTKYGNMSNDALKQFFYGCIANTTLVTRYAIEGGLEEETAFTLSDVYIKSMEKCKSLYELNLLNERMALDFTERVSRAKALKQPVFSKTVLTCMDYIARNIQSKITLDLLAKEVHLTPKYLSYLFHKETGETLSSYIEEKKINEAKTLLMYSEYSFHHISECLSFHSQSYFISVFKKRVGMTPKEYRIKYSPQSSIMN